MRYLMKEKDTAKTKPDRSIKNRNFTASLLCAAGILLNLLLGKIVAVLGLPLYLDTVGTAAVAIMGGYLPGVFCGFMTNLLKSISDPSSLYYGVLNVLIASAAAFFARRGWHKKIWGVLGLVLTFTLIGGGLGTLIPWFMEGLSFDSESLSSVLYQTGFFNEGAAHLLASLIMDLPDKAVTVLLVTMITHMIPEKQYSIFTFTGWQQTPFSENEKSLTDRTDNRIMSVQTKIILVLGCSLMLVSVVAMAIGAHVYEKTLISEHTRIAQGTARITAAVLDGDKFEDYLESKGETEDYKETIRLLEEILGSSTDITYLYVYKIREDGCQVVFDLDANGYDAEQIGSVITFDKGLLDSVPALMRGEEVEPFITDDKFGYLLTAYQPVYDSSGRCAGYVGADVDMHTLNIMKRSFFAEMASVFLSLLVLIMVFAIWLAEYHIIYPIKSIMRWMDRFVGASDTQESMDEDVKAFRRLGIHTGDEVENLFRSISRMTKEQAEQMRNIRRLSDSTMKMQDGLIITMADLVESRDSDTGAHVQKTAAYVKIIVEGLKKKGYYASKITPKFMSDVVRSAPLHDVGKINVPDGVLNKPGKLTDEEYEIMKKHTTAGKQIMEHAINTVEGDNYLKEARNMAAYHHERWDGKGYPEGIHGEVIPLSARIMAVADVFDALTSPRVYKPAFPLEKALAILEEGKGTQFDPKCVEVFMEALPEVKVVLKKYNPDV